MEHVFAHEHLMGTSVEIRVGGKGRETAEAIDRNVVSEIERLEQIFSVFEPTSELARWRRGENIRPSRELCVALDAARTWVDRTDGAFNPLVGELSQLWDEAQTQNELPARDLLDRVAAQLRDPRYEARDGIPVLIGDATHLNLNALAKGMIIDLACTRGIESGAESVCVNAGGDLAHLGTGSVRVGIENPHRPYDNEPPLAIVNLANGALATSGNSRRGFQVSGSWYGHVIDPRTGWPANHIASASVIGPDALTADVLATAAVVRTAEEALGSLEAMVGSEALIVTADGSVLRTSGWPQD